MPDRLDPLLAAYRLAVAMFSMFGLQKTYGTRSPRRHGKAGGPGNHTHVLMDSARAGGSTASSRYEAACYEAACTTSAPLGL